MIRALVWKEAREQGVIVGALAVLGAGVLFGAALLNPPTADLLASGRLFTDPSFLALVALVVTAGVVVGGTLFAGEKENGTAGFLDLLPVPRWRVWAGKLAGGAVLVSAAAAGLFAVAAGVGILGPPGRLPVWAVATFTLAMAAFGWGTVGSVLTRNSLAAAGLGGVLAGLAAGSLFPLAWVTIPPLMRAVQGLIGGGLGGSLASATGLATLFGVFALPFLVSVWLYTEPDRDRKRRAVFGPADKKTGRKRSLLPRVSPLGRLKRLAPGFRASVWMTWKQTRLAAVILFVIALLSGVSLLFPGVPAVAVWPGVTLLLGVLVGVIGWADEQGNGAGRFWVERRTPIGRLWAAKLLVGGVVTLLVAAAVVLPFVLKATFTRIPYEDRPSRLMFDFDFPLTKFLLVWPVYGFVFGHLVGLLFRKTIVAAAVAVMTAAVFAAVWLPSLLGGGLSHWQVWLPALVALLVARGLVWSMAADRIGTRRALVRLAVGGMAVLAAVGVGLAYRVVEIPSVPERTDDVAFRDGEIPLFETNDAGRELRRGAVLFQQVRDGGLASIAPTVVNRQPTVANSYGLEDPLQWFQSDRKRQLESVLEHGWPAGDAEFAAWLDAMFAPGWADALHNGVRMPLGTLEDPRDLKLNSQLQHLYGLLGADTLLLVHALRAQAAGDPTEFVRAFDTTLGLSRNIRHKSVLACALAGRDIERRAHQALTRWLERLDGRPELIEQIWCTLIAHDHWATDDVADVRLAEQTVLRNSVAAPGEVLRRIWRYTDVYDGGEDSRRVMDAEADLVGVAWVMPWEKERHARLIGAGNRRPYQHWGAKPWESPFWGMPGVGWWADYRSANLKPLHEQADRRVTADRRAAIVMLAVRRYELDHGAVPATLENLVPVYLPALPLDPYNGLPLRYRLTTDGETLAVTERTPTLPQDSDEPAVLPSDREMMWSNSPLGSQQPFGPGEAGPGGGGAPGAFVPGMMGLGGGAALEDPEFPDPTPAVTGQALVQAEKAYQEEAINGPVREFVSKRAGVTALTGFAAVLDSYLPIYVAPNFQATAPFERFWKLPAGQPVLWSVGWNKVDDGGVRLNTADFRGGSDFVYVIPLAPRSTPVKEKSR
jgi:ABC-type transport system involved in multi-copper enzyme maturation permease subunit